MLKQRGKSGVCFSKALSLKPPYSQGLAPLWTFTPQTWTQRAGPELPGCCTGSSMLGWVTDCSPLVIFPAYKACFHQEGPTQIWDMVLLAHTPPVLSTSL